MNSGMIGNMDLIRVTKLFSLGVAAHAATHEYGKVPAPPAPFAYLGMNIFQNTQLP